MQSIRRCVLTISFFLLSSTVPVLSQAKTVPALAVLSRIKAKVKAGYSKKMTEGFNGQMLLRRYRVRTEKKEGQLYFLMMVPKSDCLVRQN
jgi:hypothetical protein